MTNSRQKVVIQSSKKLPVGIGSTNRNVGGKSGKKTRGKYSTSNTDVMDPREFIWEGDKRIDVTPLPLVNDDVKGRRKDDTGQGSVHASSNVSERRDADASRSDAAPSDVGVSQPRSADQSDMFSDFSDDTGRDYVRGGEEAKETVKERKQEDLETLVEYDLSETETKTLFFLPSIAVSLKAENRADVDQLNEAYKQLIREHIGSDNYQSRPAQTINFMQKAKETITEAVRTYDKEDIQVAEWMIHDAFLEEVKPSHELVAAQFTSEISHLLKNQLHHRGVLLDPEGSLTDTHHSMTASKQMSSYNATVRDPTQSQTQQQSQLPEVSATILSSSSVNQSQSLEAQQAVDTTPFHAVVDVELPESLLNKFNIVERILTQNRYLDQQLLYRNYPKVEFAKVVEEEKADEVGLKAKFGIMKLPKKEEEEEKEEEEPFDADSPHLVDLFSYTCPDVECRHVTAADWNSINPDLLAVSYGELDPFTKKEGLLLFWTLKSPKFPERIIRAPYGISSCHFSTSNPSLIATGGFDGVVAIYDLRKKGDVPIAESSQMSEKHTDVVWEVKWHNQGAEKGENLVSISGEGRIVQWSIKKGLDCVDLLSLKKPTNPDQKEEKDSGVFRNAAGFSLDFPRGQNLMYLASTEEGTIHKCSLSYNDDLETYWGHSGPVYKVRCNPFWSNIMLTCSADWNVTVWDWRKDEEPLFSCHSLDLTDSVNDIAWSPYTSTVFTSVCDDGRIEIWDLESSNIDAVYTYKPEVRESRTMVSFCPDYPVLVSGNTKGVVDVFRMKNLEGEVITIDEQKRRLERAVYTGERKKKEGGEDDDEEDQQES